MPKNFTVIYCPLSDAEDVLNRIDDPVTLIQTAVRLEHDPPMFYALLVKAQPVTIPIPGKLPDFGGRRQ